MKKILETQNGYVIERTSTNEDWQEIIKNYEKANGKIKCIICNINTSKCFKPSLFAFGKSIITINNKIPDAVIYINRVT